MHKGTRKNEKESLLRFVRFNGVSGQKWPDNPFAQSEIRIGRPDRNRPGDDPDLNLEPDGRASRKHVLIRKEGRKWFIMDQGSKHGTLIDGKEIRGQGPVELLPGSPVQTGKTTWAVFPAEWLFIQRDNIIIYAPCAMSINYALYHCGLPVVDILTARNIGYRRSYQFSINLKIAGYSDPCAIKIPVLDPGGKVSLGVPGIRLYEDILRRQLEPVKAQLYIKIDGIQDLEARKDIIALGFWDWSYEAFVCKTISAFISPRNPIIECIVRDTQEKLKDTKGVDFFRHLLRSNQENTERLILEALYEYLKGHRRIHYESPRVKFGPEQTEIYQTVRPPQRIFLDISNSEGIAKATCLDLTLLMAGCLEYLRLCPLVLFTGDEEGVPTHAFIGCWIGSTPGGRPVIYDRGLLLRKVKSGHILVVECTGIAEGVSNHPGKLSFTEAVEDAIKQLEKAEWLCAVDIAALRPPNGSITPMDSPLEPEVVRVYDQAKQFTKSKRRKAIETRHLLYGLLAANGEVIRWVFNKAGLEELGGYRQRIEESVRMSDSSKDPIPTQNYSECQRLAEEYARESGVHSVREQDILWALLVKSEHSQRLLETCRQLGIDLDKLKSLLGQRYPQPDNIISSSHFKSSE